SAKEGKSNFENQYTTLFNGYSTMPSAPSAFSCGMISRTTLSSMIVSSAIHFGELSWDIVGLRKAGSALTTAFSAVFGRFIFNPTLLSASSAPRKRRAMISIFFRFAGLAQLFLLAMSFVLV